MRWRTPYCGRSRRRGLRCFDHKAFPASRDRTESCLAVALARCIVAALCRIAGVRRGRAANDD